MEQITSIISASPPVLLMLVLNGLGYVLKALEKVPNRIIPVILVVAGTVIYPFIGEWSSTVKAARFPAALMACYGFGIGLSAIGAYEGIRTLLTSGTSGTVTPIPPVPPVPKP